jgi:glycosyltransferase involved in cell wall biosynthesis
MPNLCEMSSLIDWAAVAVGHQGYRAALSLSLSGIGSCPRFPPAHVSHFSIAVMHILHQDLNGRSLQLVCADDASKDGSFDFLLDLACLMGEAAAKVNYLEPTVVSQENADSSPPTHLNPAFLQALRAEETSDHPSFSEDRIPDDVQQLHEKPLRAADILPHCRKEHTLTVLTYKDRINRGQGSAMTICLQHCRAPLVAQMESDDERESRTAFQQMIEKLQQNPDWDGVSCLTKCVGWERPGMHRYVDWQNKLQTPQVIPMFAQFLRQF